MADTMVEMSCSGKDGKTVSRKFTIDQANKLLKMKKPQWKLTDKGFKVSGGEIVKA